jgi:hypothetical protein
MIKNMFGLSHEHTCHAGYAAAAQKKNVAEPLRLRRVQPVR